MCGYHNKKDVKFMLKFYQKRPKHTLISILGVKKPVNIVNNQILHPNFQSRHEYYTYPGISSPDAVNKGKQIDVN